MELEDYLCTERDYSKEQRTRWVFKASVEFKKEVTECPVNCLYLIFRTEISNNVPFIIGIAKFSRSYRASVLTTLHRSCILLGVPRRGVDTFSYFKLKNDKTISELTQLGCVPVILPSRYLSKNDVRKYYISEHDGKFRELVEEIYERRITKAHEVATMAPSLYIAYKDCFPPIFKEVHNLIKKDKERKETFIKTNDDNLNDSSSEAREETVSLAKEETVSHEKEEPVEDKEVN